MGIGMTGTSLIIVRPILATETELKDILYEGEEFIKPFLKEGEDVAHHCQKNEILYLSSTESKSHYCGGGYSYYDEVQNFLQQEALSLGFNEKQARAIRYFPVDGFFDTSECKLLFTIIKPIYEKMNSIDKEDPDYNNYEWYRETIENMYKVFECGSNNGIVAIY